jgi:hypothetical protein
MTALIKLLIIEELAILIKQNANNKGAQSSHVIESRRTKEAAAHLKHAGSRRTEEAAGPQWRLS